MAIKDWPGGVISDEPVAPTGPFEDGAASGVWHISQVTDYVGQGIWPIAGNAPRGVFAGGTNSSNTRVSDIEYITIASTGNAADFGDLATAIDEAGSAASNVRGLIAGGEVINNVIEYITIASAGNATDFGDLTIARDNIPAGCNSSTRAVFGGGYNGATLTTTEYVTIASTGNGTSFGDLFEGVYFTSACSSPTRGIWGGGSPTTNTIQYITIASTGNALDFGDLTLARYGPSSCSSATRGLFFGGLPGGSTTNLIEYITIASTGNATDFGDMVPGKYFVQGACSSTIRGVVGGGATSNSFAAAQNVIQYVTIASTGNATDFGDLAQKVYYLTGLSNDNGGVQ